MRRIDLQSKFQNPKLRLSGEEQLQSAIRNPQSKIEPGLVSVIVVNWNGLAYIDDCLESVELQSYPHVEMVVVENGSTDGSRERLHQRCGENWRLVELSSNQGFAGGVNAGILASQGEFIALLNNDAVADRDWLSSLVACMTKSEVGMVASKILFYDRCQVIDKVGHLLYPDGLNRGRGAGEVDRGQFEQCDEVFFPDGCAALYRRTMFEDVGMFDEQFFAYGDDADLGLRARWRGWHCLYSPGAKVYHRHSRSLGKYSPQKAFLVERNRFWVAVKLLPMPMLLISPLFTLWRFLWHLLSILWRRGLAGGVTREHTAGGLLAALVRAYFSGFGGLGAIWKKRREVFRRRRITRMQFFALSCRYRISARELALRD